MNRPVAVSVVPSVACERVLPGYQFADAYRVPAPPGIDAIAATRMAFARGPLWIRALMTLRNRLVGLIGLKPAESTGFPVIRQSAREVMLGFDDRHLDFRVVAVVDGGFVTLNTLVRWHNAWGRAYLAAVMPFHRVIAARMVEGVA